MVSDHEFFGDFVFDIQPIFENRDSTRLVSMYTAKYFIRQERCSG